MGQREAVAAGILLGGAILAGCSGDQPLNNPNGSEEKIPPAGENRCFIDQTWGYIELKNPENFLLDPQSAVEVEGFPGAIGENTTVSLGGKPLKLKYSHGNSINQPHGRSDVTLVFDSSSDDIPVLGTHLFTAYKIDGEECPRTIEIRPYMLENPNGYGADLVDIVLVPGSDYILPIVGPAGGNTLTHPQNPYKPGEQIPVSEPVFPINSEYFTQGSVRSVLVRKLPDDGLLVLGYIPHSPFRFALEDLPKNLRDKWGIKYPSPIEEVSFLRSPLPGTEVGQGEEIIRVDPEEKSPSLPPRWTGQRKGSVGNNNLPSKGNRGGSRQRI